MIDSKIGTNLENSENQGYLDFLTKFEDPLKFPTAEALVPINPKRWSSFLMGNILSQDLKNANSLTEKPLKNLQTTKLYLESSVNTTQFCRRFGEVTLDTIAVNIAAEIGELVGSTGAGIYANQAANRYQNKIDESIKNDPDSALKHRKINIRKKNQKIYKARINSQPKNLTIGNAGPNNPTLSQFNRNRTIWSRKFFNRGGGQSIIVEIPTNQTHLLHTTEVIEYGSVGLTLILIFVLITRKALIRFRRVKNKISYLFKRIKTKIQKRILRKSIN